MPDTKPFFLLCEVDDSNEFSFGDDYASESEAREDMKRAFRNAIANARHTVEVSLDRRDGVDIDFIASVRAYGFRPEGDRMLFVDAPVAVEEDQIIVVAETADGAESYELLDAIYDDDREHARLMVRSLFDRGKWKPGASVRIHQGQNRVLWVWEADD